MQLSGFGGAPSADQIKAMRRNIFGAGDTDKSDGLTMEELTAARQNMPAGIGQTKPMPSIQEIFAKLDADASGEVTLAEMEAGDPFGMGGIAGRGLTFDSTSAFMDALSAMDGERDRAAQTPGGTLAQLVQRYLGNATSGQGANETTGSALALRV